MVEVVVVVIYYYYYYYYYYSVVFIILRCIHHLLRHLVHFRLFPCPCRLLLLRRSRARARARLCTHRQEPHHLQLLHPPPYLSHLRFSQTEPSCVEP